MFTLRRILIDIVMFFLILGSVIYIYGQFSDDISMFLYGEQRYSVSIDDVSVVVTYADTKEERQLGLSGVEGLGDREGKLFFFDQEDYYGIWMKDMLFPIDIIWINDNLEIVHIEENVHPDSFPATYYPTAPARFVLEVNAFFASTFNIEVGERLTVPVSDLPDDIASLLQ